MLENVTFHIISRRHVMCWQNLWNSLSDLKTKAQFIVFQHTEEAPKMRRSVWITKCSRSCNFLIHIFFFKTEKKTIQNYTVQCYAMCCWFVDKLLKLFFVQLTKSIWNETWLKMRPPIGPTMSLELKKKTIEKLHSYHLLLVCLCQNHTGLHFKRPVWFQL